MNLYVGLLSVYKLVCQSSIWMMNYEIGSIDFTGNNL